MKATIVLILLTLIWTVTPTLSEASGRDRHDQSYEKERSHSVTRYERGGDHDRGRDYRHDRAWSKRQHQHREYNRDWRQHPNRHAAYRPAPQRVIYRPVAPRVVYRQPAVYLPAPSLFIGVPNLSFRVSW